MPRSISASRALWTVTLLLAAMAVPATASHHEAAERPSLYVRLGGYDALAAVVDDFIGRLLADDTLTHFFVGHSDDSKARIRQLIVDQLCAATGGPCVYRGRDMKTSHAGLGITTAEWDRSVEHLVATLDKLQVPAAEKAEALATIGAMKGDIVEIE